METDPSKTSKATWSVEVNSRPLVAKIVGGTHKTASSNRELVLDGSISRDPDVENVPDDSLRFAWSCSIKEAGFDSPCRMTDGSQLVLPNQRRISLSTAQLGNMFLTADEPYEFLLTVSKDSKTSQTAIIAVTLVEALIPDVLLQAASGREMTPRSPANYSNESRESKSSMAM